MMRSALGAKTNVQSIGQPRVRKTSPSPIYLPLYSLEAAAGRFGEQQIEKEPEGWVRVPVRHRPVTKDMFVIHIKGHSMEPVIPDGSLCAFTAKVSKPFDGKLLLLEQYGQKGGERFTVKRYRKSAKVARHNKRSPAPLHEGFILESLNPDDAPWAVEPNEKVAVIGEFAFVVKKTSKRVNRE